MTAEIPGQLHRNELGTPIRLEVGTVTLPMPFSKHAEHLRVCTRHNWEADFKQPTGSLRRCPHGKYQQLTAAPEFSRIQGPGVRWWRDLGRLMDFRLYRLARKLFNALEGK